MADLYWKYIWCKEFMPAIPKLIPNAHRLRSVYLGQNRLDCD
jgi:hypothetical protein